MKIFIPFLKSNYFLYTYSALYNSGSWGKALKFRSSYLASIPFPPVSWQYLLILANFYLSLSNVISNFDSTLVSKFAFETKVELQKIYSEDLPLLTDILIEDKLNSGNKIFVQAIKGFLNTIDKCQKGKQRNSLINEKNYHYSQVSTLVLFLNSPKNKKMKEEYKINVIFQGKK